MHATSILSQTTIFPEKKLQVAFSLLVFFHHPYIVDVFTKAFPKTSFQVFLSQECASYHLLACEGLIKESPTQHTIYQSRIFVWEADNAKLLYAICQGKIYTWKCSQNGKLLLLSMFAMCGKSRLERNFSLIFSVYIPYVA